LKNYEEGKNVKKSTSAKGSILALKTQNAVSPKVAKTTSLLDEKLIYNF
jgi:hypothetical protein